MPKHNRFWMIVTEKGKPVNIAGRLYIYDTKQLADEMKKEVNGKGVESVIIDKENDLKF